MKVEHLGKIIDLDPTQASIENRIVSKLNIHKDGMRQSELFHSTGSGRFGVAAFNQAIDRLVEIENIITRTTTFNRKGFIFKLTKWGEQQAIDLEETLIGKKNAEKDAFVQ